MALGLRSDCRDSLLRMSLRNLVDYFFNYLFRHFRFFLCRSTPAVTSCESTPLGEIVVRTDKMGASFIGVTGGRVAYPESMRSSIP